MATLIKTVYQNHAPEGYQPKMVSHSLWRNDSRVYGKRFYLTMGIPASKTWISDLAAATWLLERA